MLLIWLAPPFLALLNWYRGRGNSAGRLLMALGVASVACVAMPSPWSILAGLGWYVGQLISHGSYYAMGGYTPNKNGWLDWLVGDDANDWERSWNGMFIIGFIRSCLIFIPLNSYSAVSAIIIGTAGLADIYMLSWRYSKTDQIRNAEVTYGACLGVAFIIASI